MNQKMFITLRSRRKKIGVVGLATSGAKFGSKTTGVLFRANRLSNDSSLDCLWDLISFGQP